MKKLCLVALSITLAVGLACPALATSSEEEIAAEYLKEQGILEGDQNGDMNLASGLTRAQLAAVLTRLNGNQEHVQAEQEFYISQCKFPDVPAWARLYVGYCYFNSLMVGYDTGVFGADDGVTPAAACTVVLRYMDQIRHSVVGLAALDAFAVQNVFHSVTPLLTFPPPEDSQEPPG